jgi:ABC-type Na+ efflux pump permease subunit
MTFWDFASNNLFLLFAAFCVLIGAIVVIVAIVGEKEDRE